MRYEKGRKDASRRRIMEVAAERFAMTESPVGPRRHHEGCRANERAFYPHFPSKDESRSRDHIGRPDQAGRLAARRAGRRGARAPGRRLPLARHRDNPGQGCADAALLPELARQPEETRAMYAEQSHGLVVLLASALPDHVVAKEDMACAVFATLIGTLQLARAVDQKTSGRILQAGKDAIGVLLSSTRVIPGERSEGRKSR